METRLDLIIETPGVRLDTCVAQQGGISRAWSQKLIEEGWVTVNGRSAKASMKLSTGDRVTAKIPQPSPLAKVQ